MIVVRITSGLGNQMFQYSFYRLMQETYKDTKVKADLTWFYSNNDHHGYELERVFGNVPGSRFHIDEASKAELFRVTGLIPALNKSPGFERFRRYPNRILREITGPGRKPYVIDELFGDIKNEDRISEDGSVRNDMYEKLMNLDVSKDWYIMGYFIEEKYYMPHLEMMRDELYFDKGRLDGENSRILKEIEDSVSVSIHVRRGDYLSEQYADKFVSLKPDYYKKAIEIIEERVEKPHYFIFSDDPEFAAKAFDHLDNKSIVSCNRGEDSYKDMQLMSCCRHNIIANSTFSEWAALLNRNRNRLVIYPGAYMRDKDKEEKSMEGFIRI